MVWLFFFCKQKTAYEMRISDWSSDVCSSDRVAHARGGVGVGARPFGQRARIAAGQARVEVRLIGKARAHRRERERIVARAAEILDDELSGTQLLAARDAESRDLRAAPRSIREHPATTTSGARGQTMPVLGDLGDRRLITP